jgi:hypothetical protein
LPAFSFFRDWAHSVTELRKLIAGTVLVVISNSGKDEQKKDIKQKTSFDIARTILQHKMKL